MKFNYYLPANLVFGRGRVSEVGALAAQYSKRALLVTGTGSTKRSGLLDRVVSCLAESGVETVVFDKATPNPLTTTAVEGAQLAKEKGCGVVVGLGGGSIMDCAKAVAFLSVNDGDINDYIFKRKTGESALPLILVPTTCGTGSEGNGFSVLTNPENGDKKSLYTSAIVAKASIIDSELMETMPQTVLAAVGFDALCHSMEAYISRGAQPMTDLMCRSAIALTGQNLVRVYEGERSPEAWDAITWASTIGGMVIHTAGVALPHGMEHPASGLRNIVHGRGLAALTPVITERSISGAPERYGEISRLLGGTGAEDCADTIRALLEKIGLTTSLSEQGITAEDIPWMTENCFRVSAASIQNHPVQFDREGVSDIYRAAL
ncbi:MAG: iron-containing alcohol dehydrogenase [Oscillospiraceae bacterium]